MICNLRWCFIVYIGCVVADCGAVERMVIFDVSGVGIFVDDFNPISEPVLVQFPSFTISFSKVSSDNSIFMSRDDADKSVDFDDDCR